MANWREEELAIGIRLTEIEFRPREKLLIRKLPMADAALHAVARRWERAGPERRSDADVLRDLLVLAEAYPSHIDEAEFRVPVHGGGAWVGRRVNYRGDKLFLSARTFYVPERP